MKNLIVVVLLVLANISLIVAQDKVEQKQLLEEGNRQYDAGNYILSEEIYNKALEKDANYGAAQYNLGSANYRNDSFALAEQQFESAASQAKTDNEKADALHNLGNAFMQQKKYEDAVKTYKKSLRINPEDQNTRYNLAYALEKLKQQQNNKDCKNNKDKKDGNKDKGDKDKKDKGDKDKKDKGDKDKKGDQGDENKKNEDQKEGQKDGKGNKKKEQKQATKPMQLSRAQAEKDLDAVNNDEKKLLMKLQRKKEKGKPIKTDKDW